MRKGYLVKRNKTSAESWLNVYVPDFSTGIVLTDPYAAVFTQQKASGEAIFSTEKLVVDVLVENTVINKCPIELIVRTEHASLAQGEDETT